MSRWYDRRPAASWPAPPAGVVAATVDRQTGALAVDATPPARRYTEWFLPGTEPLAVRYGFLAPLARPLADFDP